ncbi:archaellin/type IV pilin N-terminal domain-containing protein [Halobacteriales archaeon Cl-PHB]
MQGSHAGQRGQVGIGTLVVFVSMVLVASIAAGVLINTAGLLQDKSDADGTQASQQGTDRLVVVGETGTAIQNGGVGMVNVTVMRGPSADEIDLRDVTVTWVGPSGAYNVVSTQSDNGNQDGTFSAVLSSDVSADPVLTAESDRAVMTFDVGSDDRATVREFGDRLQGGDVVSVRITSRSGQTTAITLGVPESLSNKRAVAL